jgi:catechol 2,3-dioxygenase-like lactoylglutathione lyase family enzyme
VATRLNHTIVHCQDQQRSAQFLSEVMGLPAPKRFGPFLVVEADNDVSLDFMTTPGDFTRQHYAFLIDEDDFDPIFERVRERGLDYWADPHGSEPGQINHNDGGRGVYFPDPDGHLLEIITRPYGSAG